MAPKPIRYETPEGVSGLAAAASLALAVMGSAKVRRWEELPQGLVGTSIELDDDQVTLLMQHERDLRYLRGPVPARGTTPGLPAVTMLLCDACRRWVLIDKGSPPRNCPITVGCTGNITKVQKAKQASSASSTTKAEQ